MYTLNLDPAALVLSALCFTSSFILEFTFAVFTAIIAPPFCKQS